MESVSSSERSTFKVVGDLVATLLNCSMDRLGMCMCMRVCVQREKEMIGEICKIYVMRKIVACV